MTALEWSLLTTLPDLPSAQLLAEILGSEGIAVRVSSDASVLGQAAPSRIYVGATQLERARYSLSQRQFTDEELGLIASGGAPGEGEP
jgi:hypothetical protein